MQSRRTGIVLAVGALVVAIVLFAVLSGGDDSSSSENGKASFSFEFKNGEAVEGAQDLTVTKGDDVTFTLKTDHDAQLHIHGYELEKDVDAGHQVSITFPADAEGQFEVEAHPLVNGEEQTGVQLAQLSVEP